MPRRNLHYHPSLEPTPVAFSHYPMREKGNAPLGSLTTDR